MLPTVIDYAITPLQRTCRYNYFSIPYKTRKTTRLIIRSRPHLSAEKCQPSRKPWVLRSSLRSKACMQQTLQILDIPDTFRLIHNPTSHHPRLPIPLLPILPLLPPPLLPLQPPLAFLLLSRLVYSSRPSFWRSFIQALVQPKHRSNLNRSLRILL